MHHYFIGVDPGASGAIAVLDRDSDIVQIFDMPVLEMKSGATIKKKVNPQAICAELRIFKEARVEAILELVGAMPGQGVTSMFNFGRSLGILEGTLAGMDIPYEFVTPAVWKKKMKLTTSKDASRELAMRMWPQKAELFKRKKDDGRAEAALLALYLINSI